MAMHVVLGLLIIDAAGVLTEWLLLKASKRVGSVPVILTLAAAWPLAILAVWNS
jgi:hypothetical protein